MLTVVWDLDDIYKNLHRSLALDVRIREQKLYRIEEYNQELIYKPSKSYAVADALSRVAT